MVTFSLSLTVLIALADVKIYQVKVQLNSMWPGNSVCSVVNLGVSAVLSWWVMISMFTFHSSSLNFQILFQT